MRTREKPFSYIWYYTFPDDEEKVKERCLKGDPEDMKTLREAIRSAAPGIENEIYDSLTKTDERGRRIGYVELSKKDYIPVTKADFYGYQRKALAEFYRILRLLGRWKED